MKSHSKLVRLSLWSVFAALAAAVLAGWRPYVVLLRQQEARLAMNDRDFARADAALAAARRLSPANATSLWLSARVSRRQEQFDRAAEFLDKARFYAPGDARVQRERLLLLAHQGRLAEAEPHLPDLLASDDGGVVCEAFVAGLLKSLRFEDAARLIEQWKRDAPNDPEPRFREGLTWECASRPDAAMKAYEEALRLGPSHRDARLRLAETLLTLRQFTEAERHFREALRQDPACHDAALGLAKSLREQGRLDEAEQIAASEAGRAESSWDAQALWGEIALAQGRFQEAVERLAPVAERRPQDTTARYALARALQALGRSDEAKVHFDYVAEAEKPLHVMEQKMRQAVEQPRHAQLRYEIGATMLKYADPDEAARWLASALRLDPGHKPSHLALADFYERRGDRRRAALHRQLGHAPP
jgi:tetratricopeptide (TPR) repeat protein